MLSNVVKHYRTLSNIIERYRSCRGFSSTMTYLIVLVVPSPLFASDDMNGLSRQDTLPAEDPSWSYSQVRGPGQPAPIPPRREPLLYIPRASHTADDSDVHAIALCLKNLRAVKVHLPTPPANSESMNGGGTITQMIHASNPLGKVCIIDVVFTC